MNRGTNIFDDLEAAGVRYFVSDPDKSEEQNRDELIARIEARDIDFAFIYWAGLDGLLHRVGNDSPLMARSCVECETWIGAVHATASRYYDKVPLHVFSDHGMANCDVHVDLMAKLKAVPLRFGENYSAVYDSTMARFWFHTPGARETMEAALGPCRRGASCRTASLPS